MLLVLIHLIRNPKIYICYRTYWYICFNQSILFTVEEPDEGCADGLNKGLKYINNPYICVLNGDDYFLRNSLNTVVKELESKPDILIGNGFVVDSNNYLIKKFISARFPIYNQ